MITAQEASLKVRGPVEKTYNNEYDPIIEQKLNDVINAINCAIDLKYTSVTIQRYLGHYDRLYLTKKGYQLITKDLTDLSNPITEIQW